ncbi:Peptidase M20 domain-containing protein like [Verticillium longisporum]|nr:Peptidase M20 domain-containing protein like [Verticillium longisporum]
MLLTRLLGVAALARCAASSSDAQLPLGDSATAPSSKYPTEADDDAPAWRNSFLDLHRSIVEISSISGTEADVGQFLFDYLLQKGYSVEKQKVQSRKNTDKSKGRFNVLAWRVDSRTLQSKVLVTSHIDVVPPHIPYGIEDGKVTKDTKIWGRGSVDAKASVVAQIQALENLLKEGKVEEDDVSLLFVVGEEDQGDGMHTFSESLLEANPPQSFNAVIFGEPTENKLACGHKGGVFGNITAKGVAGHSGYPWLGKSANNLMIRALARVLETDLGSDETFGNTTVNIGRFDGGVAANVIPDHAFVGIATFGNTTVNVGRFDGVVAANVIPDHAFVGIAVRVAIGPQETGGDIVQARIQAILDEVDEDAFTMAISHNYGVVEANCEVNGFETAVMNYGTDIPNLKGNHTRYLYGPGSILVAHGDNESLTVGDLETAVDGFERLILHTLKESHDVAEVKLSVGPLNNGTLLCDDGIDQVMRRHVERRVPDVDPLISRSHAHSLGDIDTSIRSNSGARNLGQLLLFPLLNVDALARHGLQVNARRGGCDDELDAVMLRQDGELVGSNLIRRVAVPHNTVGADNDGRNVHLLLLQGEQGGGH